MSQQIHDIFSRIAPRYDLANTVLSLGLHYYWKKRAAELSGVGPGDRVLDCATGTGDMALLFAQLVREDGEVIGCDFNDAMLERARRKEQRADLPIPIAWEAADVLDLDWEDDHFDVAAIAYGVRNLDEPEAGLSEMARVVKPGGRVVVLEFGQPEGWVGALYGAYSRYIVRYVGGLIGGDREAYAYLDESSRAFPSGDEFVALMRETGAFDIVRETPMMGGISWVYTGSVAGRAAEAPIDGE